MPDKITAYVTGRDEAFILCPECQKLQHISVGSFKGKKHSLKVRCSCGNEFPISLNFRKGIRKKVKLEGLVRKVSQDSSFVKKCVVEDLSFKGVRIRAEFSEDFLIGEDLIVDFTLDDPQRTEIKRKVKVDNLGRKGSLGALFVDHESDKYDSSIAFYLIKSLKG